MPRRSRTSNAKMEEKKEQWVVDIETKHGSYDPGEYAKKKNRRSIYRWPNDLVAESSLFHHRAPATVSLGPYHHGKRRLQPMEHHKERALHRILHRCNIPLSRFIQSLQDVEQELRDSYDNLDPKLSPHLFLRMMLLDGCFLLEMLRYNSLDPFFGSDEMSLATGVKLDMLKLENQIPLLVLEKLLEVEHRNNVDNHEYLHQLVAQHFGIEFPIDGPHILDICRQCVIAESKEPEEEKTPSSVCSRFQLCFHLSGKGLKYMVQAIPIWLFWLLRGRTPEREHFRTASSLHKAGIKFKKGEPGSGLTMTFDEKNGVLTLPKFRLDDVFTLICVNFIAFERLHPPLSGEKWMTDYMFLMDKLIDTAEDVGVLRSQGVLKQELASDADAATVINAFSDSVFHDPDPVTKDVIKKWQKYAASDWNLALASLKQNYFQNPWSLISFFAALILLVSTIISTVFSGMQVLNGHK